MYITSNFKETHEGGVGLLTGHITASSNTLDVPFADYFRVRGGVMAEHNQFRTG